MCLKIFVVMTCYMSLLKLVKCFLMLSMVTNMKQVGICVVATTEKEKHKVCFMNFLILLIFNHVYEFHIYIYIYIYVTGRFFEVAIEGWPELDLNPRPLNSIQTFSPTELSGREFNLHSEPTLYSYSNFIVCSVAHFFSAVCLRQSPHFFDRSFLQVIVWV